jgi:DNA-binding HxlR family transcriptional regulator
MRVPARRPRTIKRVQYDVFLADCPARTTLTLIADTWSVVVVYALGEGPRRYTELQERIGGISKKMLTQTLRKLEHNGLVEHRRIRTAPPGVEYRLTELGATLLDPVRSLSRWAETHTDELLDAQVAA